MAREAIVKFLPTVHIEHTAAADVAAGQILPLSACCAIADVDIANGKVGIAHLDGAWTVTAETGTAWSAGDLIYWDDTNSKATKSATNNTAMGRAYKAKASATATGVVLLGFGI